MLDEFVGIVENALDEYNNTHKNRMNLVIFRWVRVCNCNYGYVCAVYVCTHTYVCKCMYSMAGLTVV